MPTTHGRALRSRRRGLPHVRRCWCAAALLSSAWSARSLSGASLRRDSGFVSTAPLRDDHRRRTPAARRAAIRDRGAPDLSRHSARQGISASVTVALTAAVLTLLKQALLPALDAVVFFEVVILLCLAAFVGRLAAQRVDRLLNQFLNNCSWEIEPVDVFSSVPSQPLRRLRDHMPLKEPSLITGYQVPFALESFDDICNTTYPCPHQPALMLYSPNGVFSSYAFGRQVVQDEDGLRFADGGRDRPAHLQRAEDFFDAVAHIGRKEPCGIEFLRGRSPAMYFRQDMPSDMQDPILEQIGLDPLMCATFSVFCSDAGSLTNFHFDNRSGLLQMQSGRKEVILVHPRYSEYMRALEGDLRRSWMTTESANVTVPHWRITLHPKDCLYIPSGFWHQVKSLDEYTLGTVVRFKR